MAELGVIDALRIAHWCAQAEIALVRRDAVAAPLLAQAARAADGLPPGPALAAAAALARRLEGAQGPPARAGRKAVQALCRIGLQQAQAALLAPGASA